MIRDASGTHFFWRDPALPFLEARTVVDGRGLCYGMHSHQTFSIGSVVGGRSEYRIGRARHEIAPGTVVLMNPEDVHACNPLKDLPWSYRMLYVDVPWLTDIQEAGDGFVPYGAVLSTDPALYGRLNTLFDILFDADAEVMDKECAATSFFADLHHRLDLTSDPVAHTHMGLRRAAEFITSHCTKPLRLADICHASGLSPSYLVRAFKARNGLTPHAYQVNRRIQYGQQELRRGRPIVEVALEAGFADQAHFQRAFKRHVAATPRKYATASST